MRDIFCTSNYHYVNNSSRVLTHQQQQLHRVVSTSDKLTFANAVSTLATAAKLPKQQRVINSCADAYLRLKCVRRRWVHVTHPCRVTDQAAFVAENERTTAGLEGGGGGGGGTTRCYSKQRLPSFSLAKIATSRARLTVSGTSLEGDSLHRRSHCHRRRRRRNSLGSQELDT